TLEEFIRRNVALAPYRRRDDIRTEAHRTCRQLRRGIGERKAAAKGSAVADCRMGNMLQRVDEQRRARLNDFRSHHIGVTRQSADDQTVRLDFDLIERRETFDVDEQRRFREPEIEHGYKTRPPARIAASRPRSATSLRAFSIVSGR